MLKKEIAFIYSDSAEKALYQPIFEEAKRRGYEARLTNNPFARCEIGFYCQHINHPQYSKFSLIMLHDIIQQYSNWPDIWFNEPWNKYDIGFLPSNQWVENWKVASKAYYAIPRVGIYKVGWPKADAIIKLKDPKYKKEFNQKFGLDSTKKTVLYAPAWENDNKEDEFVVAMQKLDVNIIIKQWDADPEKYPNQVKNVEQMKNLHMNLPNVTILPPETNIFNAIAVSDILVSEESSTMCEATMMGIPAVSVSDWLIPDVTPSRLPKCDYDFVFSVFKADLTEKIQQIIDNYPEYKAKTELFSKNNFSNVGIASKMIMDIVDDYVMGEEIRYESLRSIEKERLSLKKYLEHKLGQLRREIATNYSINNKMIGTIWIFLRRIKYMLGFRG